MSGKTRSQLQQNLQAVHDQVSAACARVNRAVKDVTILAVTKYAKMEWVRELVELGIVDLGEARPQQLVQRAQQLPDIIRWHLIGHLQRNKADDVLPIARMIHSVDSVRLFDHLAKLGRTQSTPPKILLEVNVAGEASKDGFDRDSLLAAWPHLRECDSLQIAGLMTMAPLSNQAEIVRPVFRQLRELRDQLRSNSDGRLELNELSMGMSGDFEIGIEEGATIVRIGSRLFEGLGT